MSDVYDLSEVSDERLDNYRHYPHAVLVLRRQFRYFRLKPLWTEYRPNTA
jgi:hypothetical protein